MCVTNTTHRRTHSVQLDPSHVAVSPSILSQRLMGNYVTKAAPSSAAPLYHASFPVSAPEKVVRPKRRRKPQKPGKTAKLNDRHFVVHNYHDHANDVDDGEAVVEEDTHSRRRGGVAVPFPIKLHAVLDQVEADGLAHVVSWQPHGRCFVIHNPKEFVDHVMPRYFRQTKLTSFQRQLNLYGFCRLTRGPDAGGYYHELFLRNKTFLCKHMVRIKVKGTRFKAASSPDQEPDFYTMPAVTVTPNHSSDEEMSHSSGSQGSYNSTPMPLNSMVSYAAPTVPVASMPTESMPVPSMMFPTHDPEADRVLDEAVDELFLHESTGDDSLAEFVHDWDPNFGQTLNDDAQLGFLLEKLLED